MPLSYFFVYHETQEAINELTDEEVGRLFRGLLQYSIDKTVLETKGNEKYVFGMLRARMDRDVAAYERKCSKNKENIGKRYSEDKQEPTTVDCGKQEDTTVYDRIPSYTTVDCGKQEDTTVDSSPLTIINHNHNHNHNIDNHKKHNNSVREPRGQYGWVALTDEEYSRLVDDIGAQEAERCIKYIDEMAQSSGNKNKWRDWNLVIRRCSREGWGKKKPDQAPARSKNMFQNVMKHGADMTDEDIEWTKRFIAAHEGGKA